MEIKVERILGSEEKCLQNLGQPLEVHTQWRTDGQTDRQTL